MRTIAAALALLPAIPGAWAGRALTVALAAPALLAVAVDAALRRADRRARGPRVRGPHGRR